MQPHVNATIRQIHDLASRVVARDVDPLIAGRRIDSLASSLGWGLTEPYIGLKGIVSQADEIPDPDQLKYWEPAAAATKQRERAEFLSFFGEQLYSICEAIRSATSTQLG